MRNAMIQDLADCTDFRQTLLARPPKFAHGTALLLVILLGAALTWAALTSADLVVSAPGRVRPVASPAKIVWEGGATLTAEAGGRVVEVNFREGDAVRQGDVLIRLDTERLDNAIAQHRRTIATAEEELANLEKMSELTARQFEAGKAKAQAELAQVEEEIAQAKARQSADIKLAEVEMEKVLDEEKRIRELVGRRAATAAELVQATAHVREAREKLAKARLPVDTGRVLVLRRNLALLDEDGAVRSAELSLKQAAKRGEVEAARLEMANHEVGRRQACLRAPIDGVVVFGDIKIGDNLERGKTVAEIAPQKGFYFEAAVSSEEVGQLRVGMPARIKLDAYDYQRYGTLSGKVVFISPDSGLPDGQRTPHYLVRIELDADAVGRDGMRGLVKLGMAGQVEIVTETRSLLSILSKKIRQTISLG